MKLGDQLTALADSADPVVPKVLASRMGMIYSAAKAGEYSITFNDNFTEAQRTEIYNYCNSANLRYSHTFKGQTSENHWEIIIFWGKR